MMFCQPPLAYEFFYLTHHTPRIPKCISRPKIIELELVFFVRYIASTRKA